MIVQASDGTDEDSLKASQDVIVTVTNLDETPVFTSAPSTVNYPENGIGVVADYDASDPEGVPIVWSISGVDAGDFSIDTLGRLTFKNSPDFEAPQDQDNNNEYLLIVQASDGTDEDSLKASQDVIVTVTNLDETPVFTSAPSTVNYPENGIGVVADYDASDPENETIIWSLSGVDSARFSIDALGRLTFNNSPDFEAPQDQDNNNEYLLIVQASDGTDEDSLKASQDVIVTVTNLDETPVFTSAPSTVNYPENGIGVVADYDASDPENETIMWSLSGNDSARFSIDALGRLTFNNSPDFESPQDQDNNNEYLLIVQASDGTDEDSLKVSQDVIVTVTNLDETPVFTSAPSTVNYPENGIGVVADYDASDPENETIIWSLSGNDSAHFSIDALGRLTFDTSPDFESPQDQDNNNEYLLIVQASDGTDEDSLKVSQDVIVTVTNLDETPVFTSAPSTVNYPENGIGVVADYDASDPENVTIVWSLSGDDSAHFSINNNGQLTFNNSPDFESPQDLDNNNEYLLIVQASDGTDEDSLKASQDVIVTVTNLDETPVFTSAPSTVNYPENGIAVVADYDASDPENVTIVWSVSGDDSAHFSIDANGQLSFGNPPDYETRLDQDTDNVYLVTIQASDGTTPAVSVDVAVTVTDVDEAADPVSPPATPEPSPTPAPTPTPVPIAVVPPEDVTPVPIAMPETQVLYLIDPSKENRVESADATVEFTFPKESTQRTYQVTIDTSAGACEGGTEALTGRVLTCTTVEIYSADAVRERDVRLIKPASATIRLTPEQVEEFGGLPVLFQVYAAGGLTVMKRDNASDPWSSLQFELDTTGDGGAEIRIPSIRDFSSFALTVDRTVLAQSRALVGAAASPTPSAPSPTATAIATVTVESTPTPMAVDLAPTPLPDVQVGDATAPPGLLLVILLAGLVLVVAGIRAVRDRALNIRR